MKKDQQSACDQLLACLNPEDLSILQKNFNIAYEQEIECKKMIFKWLLILIFVDLKKEQENVTPGHTLNH